MMSETIYRCDCANINNIDKDIRRLLKNDFNIFNRHLELCGQKLLSYEEWDVICNDKAIYYVLFDNGIPVARTCMEKYSDMVWEVADVRVVPNYRNRGLANDISRYVLYRILENGRSATMRTDEDNLPMKRVISKLGFEKV